MGPVGAFPEKGAFSSGHHDELQDFSRKRGLFPPTWMWAVEFYCKTLRSVYATRAFRNDEISALRETAATFGSELADRGN